MGTPLVIRRGPSLEALRGLATEFSATHITWNRRYEPAVIRRDTAIKKALTDDGLVAESFNGSLLFEPMHVATKDGKPYQVFTPFWRSLLAREEPAEPSAAPQAPSRCRDGEDERKTALHRLTRPAPLDRLGRYDARHGHPARKGAASASRHSSPAASPPMARNAIGLTTWAPAA